MGNPLDLAAATKFQREIDVLLPSRNMSVERTYTTAVMEKSFRWPHDRRVYSGFDMVSGQMIATVVRASGGAESFILSGSVFTAPPGINSRLSAVGNPNTPTGWIYVSEADEVETYDALGSLLSITHRSGDRVTLTYGQNLDGSASVFPSNMTDQRGRAMQFSYNAGFSLTSITLPNGTSISYGYDATNRLTQATYPDQKTRSYVFNEPAFTSNTSMPWALTGIIDERLIRFSTFTYNSNGDAVATEYAGGVNKYSVSYTNPGVTHSVTDPLGSVYSMGFSTVLDTNRVSSSSQPAGAGCAAASSNKQINASGNVTSSTDVLGRLTTYAYDAARNLETSRVEASGTPTSRTISTQWHPIWRTPVRMAEPLKITTWVYNGQPDPTNANAVLTCVPANSPLLPNNEPLGVLCKQVEQATSDASGVLGFSAVASGTTRVQTWTYNSIGQMLTHNGPRTDLAVGSDDLTQFAYYTDNQSHWRIGDLRSVTNPRGHITQFTKYDGNGRLLESQDPNGLVTVYVYTPRGWLAQLTVTPPGGAPGQTTLFEYDASGRPSKVTQPDGSFLAHTYDAAGRLTETSDNLGNKVVYTLDNMGNRLTEKWSDASGTLRRQITRGVDALNRLQTITGAAR